MKTDSRMIPGMIMLEENCPFDLIVPIMGVNVDGETFKLAPIWIRDDRMRYLLAFKTGQIGMIFH
jgi:hypothetical protein